MVSIDSQSGFCFGVVTAIRKAEEELRKGGVLYCLGDIVHNGQEVERLASLGLKTINHEQFSQLPEGSKVLIRAHGEPPETYKTAQLRGIEIIDASCPVVRHLQKKIREVYQHITTKNNETDSGQIVIFGKRGHAEVVGLQGQTDNRALVVESIADLSKINFQQDIYLFSQTTKSVDELRTLISEIESRMQTVSSTAIFEWHDTICSQVRNRIQHIRQFAAAHDKVVFVGGRNSSNGKVLYQHCKEANPDTIFIESADELTDIYIEQCKNRQVGICGATSTPLWLMQQVRTRLLSPTRSL